MPFGVEIRGAPVSILGEGSVGLLRNCIRTVARKSSTGGLCACAGRLTIKISLIYSVSNFILGGLGALGRDKATKPPLVATGLHCILPGWPNCGSSNLCMWLFELSAKLYIYSLFFIYIANSRNIVKW